MFRSYRSRNRVAGAIQVLPVLRTFHASVNIELKLNFQNVMWGLGLESSWVASCGSRPEGFHSAEDELEARTLSRPCPRSL